MMNANAGERQMPSNVEAEQAVLGSCLLDSESFFLIRLRPDEFYIEKNRWIFEAMNTLATAFEPKPIDILSVSSVLTAQNRLQLVGGISYLSSLLNAVPTAAHIKHYAELVRDTATDRRLLHAATTIAETAYSTKPVSEKLSAAQKALARVEESSAEKSGDTMRVAADDAAAQVAEYYSNPSETFGISTHLDLDKITGGLGLGDFWIVVGDPGNGKTALLHQILSNTAQDNVHSWLFSFEMIAKRVALRMACERASVDSTELRRGKISQGQYESYVQMLGEIGEYPLTVFDKPCSTDDIDALLRRAERQNNLPKIIGIDYSKLLTDTGESEVMRIANIARMGKVLATRYEICVLMIHVLKGESGAQDRMPKLSDLGWSRETEYASDVVIAAHKSMGVGVLKNREGECGNTKIPMVFVPKYTRWGNKANVPEPPRHLLTIREMPNFDNLSPLPDRNYV